MEEKVNIKNARVSIKDLDSEEPIRCPDSDSVSRKVNITAINETLSDILKEVKTRGRNKAGNKVLDVIRTSVQQHTMLTNITVQNLDAVLENVVDAVKPLTDADVDSGGNDDPQGTRENKRQKERARLVGDSLKEALNDEPVKGLKKTDRLLKLQNIQSMLSLSKMAISLGAIAPLIMGVMSKFALAAGLIVGLSHLLKNPYNKAQDKALETMFDPNARNWDKFTAAIGFVARNPILAIPEVQAHAKVFRLNQETERIERQTRIDTEKRDLVKKYLKPLEDQGRLGKSNSEEAELRKAASDRYHVESRRDLYNAIKNIPERSRNRRQKQFISTYETMQRYAETRERLFRIDHGYTEINRPTPVSDVVWRHYNLTPPIRSSGASHIGTIVPLHQYKGGSVIRGISGLHEGKYLKMGRSGVNRKTGLIIHHTGGTSIEGAVNDLARKGSGYHYIVDRDGTVVSLAQSDDVILNHAGSPVEPGNNSNNIGISLVALGESDVLDVQRDAAVNLAERLIREYPSIRRENIRGHGEIYLVSPETRNWDEGKGVVDRLRPDTELQKHFTTLKNAQREGHRVPKTVSRPSPQASSGFDITMPLTFRASMVDQGASYFPIHSTEKTQPDADSASGFLSPTADSLFSVGDDLTRLRQRVRFRSEQAQADQRNTGQSKDTLINNQPIFAPFVENNTTVVAWLDVSDYV